MPPKSSTSISIRGCRVHNLKNVDLDLKRGKLITFCGLSGSGKTSLAIDTLYAEGQRCYIESFSTYTRQFLARLDKPDCDSITGIPPAIAVTRAGGSRTNRSTVGTATEIADHLRLLFAKASVLNCYKCDELVQCDDAESVARDLADLPQDCRMMVTFPVWFADRTAASEVLMGLQQDGYQRLIIGDTTFHLTEDDRLKLAKKVTSKGVEALVVVDRLTGGSELSRLTESVETAMAEGNGRAVILRSPTADDAVQPTAAAGRSGGTMGKIHAVVSVDGRDWIRRTANQERQCNSCGTEYPEPVPRLFNFNNPLGACSTCEGFGDVNDIDMNRVVPNRDVSLRDGAIAPWNTPSYRHELDELLDLADDYEIPVDVPFRKLKKKHLKLITAGVPEQNFGGLDGFFSWLDRKKYKMHMRIFAARWRSYRTCPDCEGKRFKPEALSYRVAGLTVAEMLQLRVSEVASLLSTADFSQRAAAIASEPVAQISRRLQFLDSVGLSYLQLDRTLRTLSGGETQRVALTAALGSSLVNMLYVLDEPTAGLHPVDVQRLVTAILELRDRGNTVISVEHNEAMIRLADEVVEVGPEAGVAGGQIMFHGPPAKMLKTKSSLTGEFLNRRRGWTLRDHEPRTPTGFIQLGGARGHNLKNIDAAFPLGTLCLVTGVSGSGKSSLVHDTLYGAVTSRLTGNTTETLEYDTIGGLNSVQECMLIDQSPISRSARSCPVTYVKAFDAIRKVFAETVEARTRNLSAGHFSFNSDKGRCQECEGSGVLEIDMQFMADVSMRCPACRGSRFRDEILDVRYRDRSIADVLAMTVGQAYQFFRGYDKVQARLKRMVDVGLDYIRLGQSATSLSSGEGQRLKLASFLGSASRRKTLFIMDEPTTGLHFQDIVRLVDCFDALIADGHSLIVVEHNTMLMQAADYLIDLGPGAADDGGTIVATGTPREVCRNVHSRTGQTLAAEFDKDARSAG